MSDHEDLGFSSGASERRRSAMRALAFVGVAGAGTSLMLPSQASAQNAGGAWSYVAPGQSISAALAAGARAIQLGAGQYNITEPLVLPRGCTLRGVGQHTRLVATTTLPAVIAIGNGAPVDAVTVESLLVDCAGRATVGIDLHIVGTAGNYKGEPDSACRLDNLWVWDAAADGIVYRGSDTQACVTSRVRVRRAGRYGYNVSAPDNWWVACEATTSGDNSAGFFVASANNFFQACKAWYCRGYGFHVRGTRNKFTGCETQDTRSHGWFIEWDKNVFTGCVADSAGFHDVGGTPDTADGFYFNGGSDTSIVGCQSFDRSSGGIQQQRYGFNVPRSFVDAGLLVAPTGWNNLRGLLHAR